MARPTWTTDEQRAWLTARKKAFIDARANGTSRAWLNATTEAFLTKWPILPPTEQELAEEKGNFEAYQLGRANILRRRVEWWFRNRARANAGGRANATTAVLNLTRRRSQALAPYQAYMHVYSNRVMPMLKDNYRQYKTELPVDEQPREWWGWAIAEAMRLYELEPEDVKAAVEAYRQLHSQSSSPAAFDLKELTDEGLETAQERVRGLQRSIHRLARTAYEACKAIEEQTGWKATMLLGGPNPETGRMVSLTVHNGRTLDLQNIFSEATEKWSTIQQEWDTFIARCYRPDLAESLERLHSGEMDDVEFAALMSSLQVEPAVPDAPSPDTPAPEAPEAPAPADDEQAAPSSTSTPDAARSAPAAPKAPRELTYEEQRHVNVARNKIILQRVLGGEKAEDIMASLELGKKDDGNEGDSSDELGTPAWVIAAKEHLESVSEEGWWLGLVSAWAEFEKALEHPDGAAQSNWLSPKCRPEEVKYWIARGRKYDKAPKIKSLPTFIGQFQKWWARIQPSERRDPDDPWPLLKVAPEDEESWSDVRRGGCNGLFMVVMCLSWWMKAIGDSDDADDVEVLRETVEDVKWAIYTMVPLDPPVDASAGATPVSVSSQSSTVPPAPNGALSPTSAKETVTSPATAATSPAAAAPAAAATAAAATVSPAPATTTPATAAATASPAPATTAPAPAAITASPAPAAASTTASPKPTPSTTSPSVVITTHVATPLQPVSAVTQGQKRSAPQPEHEEAPAAKKLELTLASMGTAV